MGFVFGGTQLPPRRGIALQASWHLYLHSMDGEGVGGREWKDGSDADHQLPSVVLWDATGLSQLKLLQYESGRLSNVDSGKPGSSSGMMHYHLTKTRRSTAVALSIFSRGIKQPHVVVIHNHADSCNGPGLAQNGVIRFPYTRSTEAVLSLVKSTWY